VIRGLPSGSGKTATGVSAGPLAVALLIAGLIHLLLISGVRLPFPKANPEKQAPRPLELLVRHRAGPSNEQPALADAERSARPAPDLAELSPKPTTEEELLLAPAPPPRPEPEPTRLTRPATREQPAAPASSARLTPEPKPEPQSRLALQPLASPVSKSGPTRVDATQILASRDRALAELTAKRRQDSATAANRPRRKAIRADTREYKYANYLEAWRRKVERVGNLNYPEAAKRLKLYGSLILHIALRADGSLERVRVLRSSSSDLLDQAAVKIVRLAAPFAPFPPAIRAEAEVLDITRTWQFLSNNRLGWEH